MLNRNDTDDFDFEDTSYQDNYENAPSGDDTGFASAEGLFEGNTSNIFGDSSNLFDADIPNNQGMQTGFAQGQGNFQQAQMNPNYQQAQWQGNPQMQQQQMWQQNQQMQQQQNQQQGNVMLDNFRRQAGRVVENGGVKLKSKHLGIAVIILGIIVLLIIGGLHSLANRPKKVKQQSSSQPVPVQETQNTNKVSKGSTSSVDTLNLIVVDDKVPIDYTSAMLETTGLVTDKQTFVVDNQVIYCLNISMTVGNETKLVRHFCNRSVFKNVTTGTVVQVNYQQVDEHNIAISDISM